jgi:uncharacterized protein
MEKNLNIKQRLFAAILYIVVIAGVLRFFSGKFDFLQGSDEYGLMFVSAALLLIFGTYITEPYFTKPIDTITNTVAILIALVGVRDKSHFVAYKEFLVLCALFLIFGLITVIYGKDSESKWQTKIYSVVTTVGRSRVSFSILYLLTLVSFFTKNQAEFWALLTFWVVFLSGSIVESLVVWLTSLIGNSKSSVELGVAIGRENPFLYKVKVDRSRVGYGTSVGDLVYISAENGRGLIGVVANAKTLLNERWLTVYLILKGTGVLSYSLKSKKLTTNIDPFSPSNKVHSLDIDIFESEDRKTIRSDVLFKNSSKIIGYVAPGSNISRVRFETLPDLGKREIVIREGMVVEILVNDERCLYQIIDANTDEEKLELHNSNGFTTGIAQKLGKYIAKSNELATVKWLPNIYTPVYCMDDSVPEDVPEDSIGTLPGTRYPLTIKDPNGLITHNTAILGILGIGKSSLTFELIQKATKSTNVKVICIDITNEYAVALKRFIDLNLIVNDFTDNERTALKISSTKTGNDSKPSEWGNEKDYRTKIDELLKAFESSDNRLLIVNPDLHAVTKAATQFKICETSELSIAQKTRIIAERIFMLAREKWSETGITTTDAKFWVVFEEAHSLIPEWNSSANDGDQNAANGTAKVIMQGRKYGLGSLVVTQRTANISKSILNQCNTIFAMRIFDDTGKQFLENYVGSDYSNALPTLEERHAVVVGKALKLKQPVIIQLNDRANIELEEILVNSSK